MDWFLYDNGLPHETVKQKLIFAFMLVIAFELYY